MVCAKAIAEETGLCRLVRMVCDEIVAYSGNEITEDLACTLLNSVYCDALEKKEGDMHFTAYSPRKGIGYEKAREYLDCVFLEDEIKAEVEGYLLEAENAMQELIVGVNGERPFPSYLLIEKYLTKYYELLKSVLRIADKLKDVQEFGTGFLENVLNVGLVFPVEKPSGDSGESSDQNRYASLYAPGVLNGVARLYGALAEYGRCTVGTSSERLKKNYQEVLVSKVLRYFNWFIVHDGEVMRLEIPASLYGKKEMKWSLNIPIRPLNVCNSYEGIGELRLLDKVLYEIERLCDKRKENLNYNVAVVGDIESGPMDQLCKAVKYFLTDYIAGAADKVRVMFTVLTYNEDDHGHSDDRVGYNFVRYDRDLLRADKLKRLIERHDLIFLLDCCDLYNVLKVEAHDKNLIWQKVADDTYRQVHNEFLRKKDFMRDGNFSELIEELYIFNYSGKFGKWQKRLNHSILSHLCGSVKQDSDKERSIYAYISDMEAFDVFEYEEQQVIRVENYNDKQVAILRISDYKEGRLEVEKDVKLIVFTLWQLIKHIAIRNIDEYLESFGLPVDEARSGIFSLRKTLIGVDYSNWPEKLEFYYQMPEEIKDKKEDEKLRFEERLRKCMEVEVMPFFKDGARNMFAEYFIKSFSSFLYSDAKNVNDMLFLHLFRNCHSLLKKVELANEERKDLVKYQREWCKYSQKQYYYDMMRDYDTSSGEFAFKYTKLHQLEKKEPELRRKIFENIKQACEENSYTDSYLYRKC